MRSCGLQNFDIRENRQLMITPPLTVDIACVSCSGITVEAIYVTNTKVDCLEPIDGTLHALFYNNRLGG